MLRYTRVGLVTLFSLAMFLGSLPAASAQETQTIKVNVAGCVDSACENTVDIFTMDGATVSVYDANGALVDSCTVSSAADDFDGCVVAPAPEGGSYDIAPSVDYADYSLLSATPEVFESEVHGTAYVWYFVPLDEVPQEPSSPVETVPVNVIICVDPDCADTVNIETMVGATVRSYAPDDTVVDSCTVTVVESQTICNVVPPPDGGWYQILPTDEYAGYVLVSETPEIFESEMRGPIYVWYFAPLAEETAAPEAPAAPARTNAPATVTGLPSTGSGPAAGSELLVAFGAVPFALAAAAMVANRLSRRQ